MLLLARYARSAAMNESQSSASSKTNPRKGKRKAGGEGGSAKKYKTSLFFIYCGSKCRKWHQRGLYLIFFPRRLYPRTPPPKDAHACGARGSVFAAPKTSLFYFHRVGIALPRRVFSEEKSEKHQTASNSKSENPILRLPQISFVQHEKKNDLRNGRNSKTENLNAPSRKCCSTSSETNTVVNATKSFTLVIKILLYSPIWRVHFWKKVNK